MTNAPAPANTILIYELHRATGEGMANCCNADCQNAGESFHTYVQANLYQEGNQIHNEGCNYGFCDGHAKWMKEPDVGMWTCCPQDDLA